MARPSFQVRARPDRSPVQDEIDAQSIGDRSCRLGLQCRFGSQRVIDMVGGDVAAVSQGERDQRRRIRATGERARDGRARVGEGAVGEECVELAQSSCSRWRLPPGYRWEETCLR